MQLLKLYRKAKMRMIADVGIRVENYNKNVRYFEHIPMEYRTAISDLDAAYGKLYHYLNGGAGDYAAIDVEKFINSERARLPRKHAASADNEEIAEYLMKRNYSSSVNKKEIILDAMERFDACESKVRKAANKHGLTNRKKTTVR